MQTESLVHEDILLITTAMRSAMCFLVNLVFVCFTQIRNYELYNTINLVTKYHLNWKTNSSYYKMINFVIMLTDHHYGQNDLIDKADKTK